MKSLAIFYFYQELAEQCMFAKMAKVDLKNGSSGLRDQACGLGGQEPQSPHPPNP
jgi:hypothetical protein